MAETALNFGPDWIRAYSAGAANIANPPSTMPIPKYSLAEFRYGREEMLALIPKDVKLPPSLKEFPHLVHDQFQMPLALIPITEDEQRLWTRSVNSDAALRASGKSVPGMGRTGRGASVDRGRGRGRGGYYQRGLMHDDSEDGLHGFARPKPVERSLSANERDLRWDDRDRRYDRPYPSRGSAIDDGFSKQDNLRGQHDYWRKYDKDDEGDWRTSGSRPDRPGGRGSWRNSSDKDRRDMSDRDRRDMSDRDRRDMPGRDRRDLLDRDRGDIPERDRRDMIEKERREMSDRDRRDFSDRNPHNRNTHGRNGPSPHKNHSWKDSQGNNLPEWSVEEAIETDTVGTFDSSGAFLETKTSDSNSLDEIYISDDADEGLSKDSPEAEKEISKKMPKKSPNSASKKSGRKKTYSISKDEECVKEKVTDDTSETVKRNSKNSKTVVTKSTNNVIKTDSNVDIQKSQEKDSEFIPVVQSNVPIVNSKTSKVEESVVLKNLRTSENATPTNGIAEEDAFAHHKKATENMVAQWTEEEEQVISHTTNSNSSHEKDVKWFYQDPQGDIQGPFASAEMLEWFSAGYFTVNLKVRRSCDDEYRQLGDLIKAWGRVPFMPGSHPPPIRATTLASTLTIPITQTSVPIPASASASSQLPKQDDLLALQQRYLQQQLLQQQYIIRQQAQIQATLAQLKTHDSFTSLSSQQQEQVVMRHIMTHQQVPRPNINPLSEQSSVLDPLAAPLSMPLLGLTMPPVINDMSLWNTSSSGTWPLNLNTTQPPGTASIWDNLLKSNSEESDIEKQKKLLEEQKARKAEELRLEQLREAEEKRIQEELKCKEEALRLQELQKQEEEKRRLEEMKRIQEEENKRQEERRRLEEQRRQEEDRLKQEELRRQEELKKQAELRKQEELKELKRLEEQKRQEELRKQEEQRQLEELRKKEELRKQEEIRKQQEKKLEEKRKKEEQLKEEKRKQSEREQEKLLELERQKEALRQKEIEREEKFQAEKREREELDLMKLAELKLRTQGPVWGMQNAQPNTELSLADIQRIQEEKEREEREEKLRQQARQQQTVKQVQQNKNGLSWAKRATDGQPVVKSLIEIQQEEAERLAFIQRTQKPQPPPPTLNSNTGVWGNSSHLNKIAAPPQTWNLNSVSSTTGFWDDVISSNTQSRKQPQKANESSAFPALANRVQPATVNNNKNKNVRAKKEEDVVTRLFGSHLKPTDEFTKWCTEALSSMQSSVDVPTFVAFLKDIESPYEVYDYVKSYLGEGKEPREFAKQFLEKRSKFRNQAKQAPAEDNTLWGPAPAITPTVNKPVTPSNDCDGNSNAKGKTKRRKNRMQKLDNSMLGFTVQSNPDRLNVGEIDHIDGM